MSRQSAATALDEEDEELSSCYVNGGSSSSMLNRCNYMFESLNSLKESYYADGGGSNKKNMFFKSNQKNNCAQSVANQVDMDEVMRMSFFAVPNKRGHFYMNYPIMKMYVNNENHSAVMTSMINEIVNCIREARNEDPSAPFYVHLNLNSLTVSATERYKYVVDEFHTQCVQTGVQITPFVTGVVIYYAPSMMSTIVELLKYCIEPGVLDKIKLISSKDESFANLEALFN